MKVCGRGFRFACALKETSRQLPDSSAEETLLVGLSNSGQKFFSLGNAKGSVDSMVEQNQQPSSRCKEQGGLDLGHHGKSEEKRRADG